MPSLEKLSNIWNGIAHEVNDLYSSIRVSGHLECMVGKESLKLDLRVQILYFIVLFTVKMALIDVFPSFNLEVILIFFFTSSLEVAWWVLES